MANTVWRIEILMQSRTGQGAAGFLKMGKAALQAAADGKKLDRQLLALGSTLTNKVDPALKRTGSAFKTLASTHVSGFSNMGRSAASFSRTVGTVSRQSVAGLSAVTRGARQSAVAFNAMAIAANRMPRVIRPAIQQPALHTGGMGLGYTAALGLAAGGAMAGGAMLTGIQQAADLQTAMVGVQNATGASVSQMARLQARAYEISALTAQSVVDSAHVMAVMARSGINDPNKLYNIAKPAALFADVQFLSRGTPFEEGAKNAIMLAHLFHAYQPDDAAKMFDSMTRLSEMMPDNLGKAVTQMGYFVPQLSALNVPRDQSIGMMALLDRVGYGKGKGGTGVAALVNESLGPLQITTHAQVRKNALLQKMGILGASGESLFYDKQTQSFNLMGFLKHLSDYASHQDRAKTVQEFKSVFGTGGGRIADMAIDKQFTGQLQQIMSFMGRNDLGMVAQQARYMNTLNGQFQLFRTNFQSFLTDLMWPWLDDLRSTFSWLAEKTHDAQAYLHQHRGAEKVIGMGLAGTAIAGAAASLIVGGYITSTILGRIMPHGTSHLLAHLVPAGGAAARVGALGLAGRVGGAALGLGAIPMLGSGLARLGGGANLAFRALAPLRAVQGLDVILLSLGRAASAIGRPLALVSRLFPFLAGGIFKVGLRVIPVVGEIFMLADTIHFFFTHAKDIGYLLGKAARWMADNVPRIISSSGPRFFDAMKSLVGYMLGALNPANWAGAFQGFLSGITSGFNAKTVGPPAPLPKPAPGPPRTPASASQIVPSWMGGAARGGYTTAEGLAYLHKGEVVVNHRTTRALDRLTAPGHSGGRVVNAPNITLHYNAPAGESDAMHRRRSKQMNRDLAQAVAAELSRCAELGMRSGGAIPQMADSSVHAFLAGVPS